jgi:hypothetical protein
MGLRVTGWLVNTCLLGLVPVIARLFVWSVSTNGVIAFAVSDLVSFGLVIHSANINDLARSDSPDTSWITILRGLSIIFVIIYALLLFTTILSPRNLDQTALLKAAGLLCSVSFFMGIAVLRGTQAAQQAQC